MNYFLAKKRTPIFNTQDLKGVFHGGKGGLALDHQGRCLALEMVAFPGAVFKVTQMFAENIAQVQYAQYPINRPLFIDVRFGRLLEKKPKEPKLSPCCLPAVRARLRKCLRSAYIWGGNDPQGVADLLKYYPPELDKPWTEKQIDQRNFKGVDCSGLLYFATKGAAPRNTDFLLFYGSPISIDGLTPVEIAKRISPLDLIVYHGHLIIALTKQEAIESRCDAQGVVITSMRQRLAELIDREKKLPTNDPRYAQKTKRHFVVRKPPFHSSRLSLFSKIFR